MQTTLANKLTKFCNKIVSEFLEIAVFEGGLILAFLMRLCCRQVAKLNKHRQPCFGTLTLQ